MATQASKQPTPTQPISKTTRTLAKPRVAKKQVAPVVTVATTRRRTPKADPTILQNQTTKISEESNSKKTPETTETPIKFDTSTKTLGPRKIKKININFTIPKDEINIITNLKLRATQLSQPTKKNILIRAGIKYLTEMNDKDFIKIIQSLSIAEN